MSTFSFLEKPPEWIIGTSTAIIMSPCLEFTLMAPHKVWKLMPLGWTLEKKDGYSFIDGLWRELGEEWDIEEDELQCIDRIRNRVFWVVPSYQRKYGRWNFIDTLYVFIMLKKRECAGEKKCNWIPVEKMLTGNDHGMTVHRLAVMNLLGKIHQK